MFDPMISPRLESMPRILPSELISLYTNLTLETYYGFKLLIYFISFGRQSTLLSFGDPDLKFIDVCLAERCPS